MIFGEAEHIGLPPMCDNEPKGTEILPFQAGSSFTALAKGFAYFFFFLISRIAPTAARARTAAAMGRMILSKFPCLPSPSDCCELSSVPCSEDCGCDCSAKLSLISSPEESEEVSSEGVEGVTVELLDELLEELSEGLLVGFLGD